MIDWAKARSPRTFSTLPSQTKSAVSCSIETVRHGEPGGWLTRKNPAICSDVRLDWPMTGTEPGAGAGALTGPHAASTATTRTKSASRAGRWERFTRRVIGLPSCGFEGEVAKVTQVVRGASEVSRDARVRCEVVTTAPRIGLVLGAGGVIGHAYHA